MNHFCFELSLTIDCQPELSFRLSGHYVGLRRYNSSLAHRSTRMNVITDQLRQKISKQMDFSPANQRKHSLFDADRTNDTNNKENLLTIVMTWLTSGHTSRYGLYRIAIHFGQIEFLKATINADGLLWACFRVKHDRVHKATTKNDQIYCRTKPQPFQKCNDGLFDSRSFDESFTFFGHFDLTEHGSLSLVMTNPGGSSQHSQLTFKCPLIDYLRQPSVNQYFYLEPTRTKRHMSDQSYCTLQFSICIQSV
ncbi:hypothetical protein BLA29_006081 [Euroglyphus maynei]|uniref:Uncharacterized protein n=1 Tax=Euroglyphus maynei TaxID=6958 RepID=A0A1Y3B542_EURMA|nr:hypothetical protein BLA29_006081 [Euroglyphus maynei]